ncbi:MAG: ABC transporter permease [Planctomycetes bacterium]|nr:ABC transporter permease [Planctomycetota bacterium]
MVGIAIGIAAVLLLTSIGEGTRRYILTQFTQFGTNILAVNPGKTDTLGIPGVLGGTTHKLTLEDAEAMRRVAGVDKVVAVAMGQARVEAGQRGRSVPLFGVTPEMPEVWKFRVRQGSFLPAGDLRRGAPVTVLGPTLKRELFGSENALGKFVRAAGFRLRVVGVIEPKGQMLGYDIDDCAYVPVATAMRMFNLDELIEIDVLFHHERLADSVARGITRRLTQRHGGREDFTVTTQTAMLETFGNIMDVITLAVGGIAAISLLVGAIGILTLMWIAVGERTGEIGLLRALGASASQVHRLFLAEAAVLAGLGGVVGLVAGLGLAALLRAAVAGLPVYTPLEYVLAALVVSVCTGLLAGVLPARRAARLHPIEALRAE